MYVRHRSDKKDVGMLVKTRRKHRTIIADRYFIYNNNYLNQRHGNARPLFETGNNYYQESLYITIGHVSNVIFISGIVTKLVIDRMMYIK